MSPSREKLHVSDLGILGGPPAFDRVLHVGRPNIGDRQEILDAVGRVLDSGRLTNRGPRVEELERRLAEWIGVRHCIATCNATAALEVLARAAGFEGEVIVPSFTFVATAHALQWLGINPVFADVDPATHNLDARHVESLVTARTTAIMGVHLWGRGCDVRALAGVAGRHGLDLVFDASHALGCAHEGRMIGGFGRAEVFSFHATKVCNAFEGGAIVTNDTALAERIRLMINFGFADYDRVVSLGVNAKLNEVSAAMGLASLDSLEDFVAVNRRNHDRYAAGLAGIPGVTLVRYDPAGANNHHYVVLEIDADRLGLTRDQLQTVLTAENVLARRYFFPGCHRMEPYISRPGHAPRPLPGTEHLAGRVLCLPTGTSVSGAEVDKLCGLIQFTARHAGVLRARLAARDSNPEPTPMPRHA